LTYHHRIITLDTHDAAAGPAHSGLLRADRLHGRRAPLQGPWAHGAGVCAPPATHAVGSLGWITEKMAMIWIACAPRLRICFVATSTGPFQAKRAAWSQCSKAPVIKPHLI
jgi:hypothetical protein